jgi:predicted ATPase
MPVRLHLLGTPRVQVDAGAASALPFERRSQIVALLALRGGWVARAELAGLLWPQQDTAQAQANLRKALFRLQALPWGGVLASQGGSLRCDAETDVQAFEQALRAGRLAEALALHGGPLLAGFDDAASEPWTAWLRFERERVAAAWRAAALTCLDDPALEPAQAVALSARLLDADALDEAALRQHMTALARAGQPGRAREAYQAFAARLAEQLGLAPGAESQTLHAALGAAAGRQAQAAHAALPDDGFVGRAAERRQLAELLAREDVRLVCLAGQGGVGKTRLARRVLADLAPARAGAAAFVPLEDLAPGGALLERLAHASGVALRGSAPALDQLAAAWRERPPLLVLDNFEHLAEEAGRLEALLAACPGLQLLVTSRMRLGLAGEHLVMLEGLPSPEREDADRLESFDAARLFIAAAQRVEPALVPAAEADAIVEICRQVDGLPLALELAAAWTRMLPCATIAAELREGTELLRAAGAAGATRHASLELVFDQSWRRLSPAERSALARLAVCQGGFSAEAARAVAGAPLPVLGALADKSLLRKEGARLSLHPLVQQLAGARLDDAARAAARSAHAAFFHHWLAQRRAAVEAGERAELQALDDELENCRLAWRWSVAQADAAPLRASAAVLQLHFDHRGRFGAGLALLRQAIEAPALQGDAELQALLLGEAAQFEYRLDRYADAEATAARALAAAPDAAANAALRLRALNVRAAVALRTGDLERARRHFDSVLALATARGHAHHVAAALDHLALVEKRLGRYDEALRLSLASLAQHREIGAHAGVALCLTNLGNLLLGRGEAEAALPYLQEALALSERDGLEGTLAYALSNLAEAALRLGDAAAAGDHAARALAVAERTGNRAVAAWMQIHLARVAVARADAPAARAALAAGAAAALALGLPLLKTAAAVAFAELLHGEGHTAAACRVMAFAADHPATSAPDRDEIRARLAGWVAAPQAAAPSWPALTLDELVRRIGAEGALGHAPLRALLAGSGTTAAA